MSNVIKVLIADDHRLVRTFLRDLLSEEDDLELVAEASDGAEAIRLATETNPDVAVLDLAMPGVDGLEAIIPIAPNTSYYHYTGLGRSAKSSLDE